MDRARVLKLVSDLGFYKIPSTTKDVFVDVARHSLLKLVDPARRYFPYTIAGFEEALELSRSGYARDGLMPEVLSCGKDFEGSGWGYIIAEFVEGRTMNSAYPENPSFWDERFPEEIVRLYQKMQARPVGPEAAWRAKIDWVKNLLDPELPPPYAELHAAFVDVAQELASFNGPAYRIHADLHLSNILARADDSVILIDWAVTHSLTLEYEFALLFVNLIDPLPQADPSERERLARVLPLTNLEAAMYSALVERLGIVPYVLRRSIVLAGSGGLLALGQAMRDDDRDTIARQVARLRWFLEEGFVRDLPV